MTQQFLYCTGQFPKFNNQCSARVLSEDFNQGLQKISALAPDSGPWTMKDTITRLADRTPMRMSPITCPLHLNLKRRSGLVYARGQEPRSIDAQFQDL